MPIDLFIYLVCLIHVYVYIYVCLCLCVCIYHILIMYVRNPCHFKWKIRWLTKKCYTVQVILLTIKHLMFRSQWGKNPRNCQMKLLRILKNHFMIAGNVLSKMNCLNTNKHSSCWNAVIYITYKIPLENWFLGRKKIVYDRFMASIWFVYVDTVSFQRKIVTRNLTLWRMEKEIDREKEKDVKRFKIVIVCCYCEPIWCFNSILVQIQMFIIDIFRKCVLNSNFYRISHNLNT